MQKFYKKSKEKNRTILNYLIRLNDSCVNVIILFYLNKKLMGFPNFEVNFYESLMYGCTSIEMMTR